jgi:hypothetical protein
VKSIFFYLLSFSVLMFYPVFDPPLLMGQNFHNGISDLHQSGSQERSREECHDCRPITITLMK